MSAEPLPDARYDRVAWVLAEGDTRDLTDVVIEFKSGGVEIRPRDVEIPAKTLSYSSIVSITYSRTEPSRLSKLLMRSNAHWLNVKMRNDAAVLRLDSRNYLTIIEAFEKRTGVKVER